jgi:dimeric dUTPase (all-alpha-NTP-PPase superfamily)
MKTMKEFTEVQFRRFRGEIIAVFPYEIWSENNVASYMHIGQHSGCFWGVNNNSKPATKQEYMSLYNELVSIGYNLQIIKRRNHSKYLQAYYAQKQAS